MDLCRNGAAAPGRHSSAQGPRPDFHGALADWPLQDCELGRAKSKCVIAISPIRYTAVGFSDRRSGGRSGRT
ncbi:hypothetical protein E2562_004512, partial [Oryza meyeriana var. granulata]